MVGAGEATTRASIYTVAVIRIIVNGQEHEALETDTLAELLERQGLSNAACATEVNAALVPRRDRGDVRLKTGDRIEIVSLIGGG